MKSRFVAFGAIALSLATSRAIADDSSAALGMGGLEFTKSEDIRMADENLKISPRKVEIRFVFTNDSDRDIDTVVAFPLPDIDTEEYTHSALGTTTKDPVNFVNFEVRADGKRVIPSVEQRAFLKNRDVTALVKAAGLPVNAVTNYAPMEHMKLRVRKHLLAEGLLEPDDPGNNFPLWIARTKFFWKQHFPAHKSVVLEQSYQPVTGQSFFSDLDLNPKSDNGGYYLKDYCLGDGARAVLAKMIAASKKADPQNSGLLYAYRTEYVLKTGNNWKGPIGHFRLTLDKLKPGSMLSMCWDGELKKTGLTTFEDERANFSPKQDIRLVVLDSARPQ
ncbi:MAG TPA: DUF4424 family protein [Rhizomicrobium sp.]|nr:DUF4424 family protein [Rhizomicrobium sp.]